MLGIVPVLILQDQASIDTFLYLTLNLVSLLLKSWIGPRAYLMPHELMLQLEIHLDWLVTGG